ncbi:MAG: type II secretion system protein N [Steroidobacteraceae bacterium]
MTAVRSWLDTMISTREWPSTVRARAPQAAVWVLAAALGVQAALIVTRWAGSGAVALPVAAAPIASASRVDIASIVNQHLFGAAPEAAGGPAGAPRTTLQLVLTGTIAASRPKDGLAILGASPTAVKVYAVGDSVPGGARLHAVYANSVLLERGAGRLESLTLLKGFPSSQPRRGRARTVVRQAVARVRQMMTNDPGALEKVMRPQPVFSGGKLKGYRLYPGPNSRAFASLGLKPGDLVTEIDGTPLNDPSRAEEIFRTLGSSSEAHVTVLRGGRQQDLTFNLASIASEANQLASGENGRK